VLIEKIYDKASDFDQAPFSLEWADWKERAPSASLHQQQS